jgi:dihydrodipicolinate synthase/N-acetylneuraminate lyase
MAVFTGIGVALVTLFDDAGEVDYAGTARLAVELVGRGVRAVVVSGTTGEVDTLDDGERVRLFEAVREAVTGAVVIAGTGAASTRQARSLTASARERGVDAVLARSPRGVADPTGYYEGIAAVARELPVLGYHFPQVAPPGIPLELLPKLPIQGCKDSSGDMDRLLATLDGWSQPLYVGSSAVLLQAGAMGAAGAILALANSEPELCAAAFAGDPRAQRALTPAHLAALEEFPRGVKRLVAEKFGTSTVTRVG